MGGYRSGYGAYKSGYGGYGYRNGEEKQEEEQKDPETVTPEEKQEEEQKDPETVHPNLQENHRNSEHGQTHLEAKTLPFHTNKAANPMSFSGMSPPPLPQRNRMVD